MKNAKLWLILVGVAAFVWYANVVSSQDLFITIGWLSGWVIMVFMYLLPTYIAHNRSHHNYVAIAVTNVVLGWTIIGWIIAIIWAATAVRPMVPAANCAQSTQSV